MFAAITSERKKMVQEQRLVDVRQIKLAQCMEKARAGEERR
jgi:hypothetical protein